ncbi:hypothetical protein J3R82DRAFT_8279 [Butyriboletus roseoflavus]|nr:hypothetical protein J3R82DRAFT_8279 [Butyriboletus roseoflavus]
MLTSVGSRLFRFLLSLVIHLRRSVGRIALAFRARLASFWRSILIFARCRDQSLIRLHANDVPVMGNNSTGECPQISERAMKEEEDSGLAVPPVRPITLWEDKLSKYQALMPSDQFKFDPHPATPEGGSLRYKPRTVSQTVDPPDIPAGRQRLLSALPPLPEGWRRQVHPEGSILFYHEELRLFTESDIFQREEDILFCAATLIQQAIQLGKQTGDAIMDELTEIVLNVDNTECWHYYFVDHGNRLLFWVQPVRPHDLDTDLQGISEFSHIRYLVETLYWSHCEYYPHNRTLPKKVFEDLRGMLNYAKTDMLTTDSSSSPFAQDELVAILDLVNSLKDYGKISDPYSIWIIARLMEFLTENQFLNFCGQQCARLNADTPLFGQQTWNRSVVFKVVNMLLLGSPNEHAVRLQRVWVDGIIIQPRWTAFINRLTNELGRYPIFSTVMLAVNISFLAVPGVITAGSPASQIEIIIYCSVVSTIGSIAFSFTLANVYSDPGLMSADTTAEVMKTLGQTKWGMACLAITHSLPIACLIWSITLFSTALVIQIFGPEELATVTTLGVECFILVLFGVMSGFVLRLFSRNDDSAEDDSPPTEPQHDLELGSAKCFNFRGR